MFFTERKLTGRMEELRERRYFGHQAIAPFVAMEGQPYQGVDTNHQEVVFSNMGEKKATLTFMLWTGLEGGGPHRTFRHRCLSYIFNSL